MAFFAIQSEKAQAHLFQLPKMLFFDLLFINLPAMGYIFRRTGSAT